MGARQDKMWMEFGELIKRRREDAGLTQPELAEQMTARTGESIKQPKVSRNEHGAELSRKLALGYQAVLGISAADFTRVMAGLDETESDAESTSVQPATFEAVVQSDPDLSDGAKSHLLNQYELLRDATSYARSKSATK